ncbi:MAG: hypothetical protein RLZZ618_3654 [Pseudomonadota bacterium]
MLPIIPGMTPHDADPTATSHDASTDDGPYAPLKAFLLAKGVARHKQTAEVAGLLGLAKTSVFRKFKGESSFTLPELKVVADHFGTDVDTLRGLGSASAEAGAGRIETARLCIAGMPALGQLQVGPPLEAGDVCDLVAVSAEDGWEVHLWGAAALAGRPGHAVASLRVSALPRQRIALLEDDSNAAAIVAMALEAQGMVVHTFQEPAALITALGQRSYQAYVIDWLLGGSTAAEAIREIRQRQSAAPIAITTGALNTGAETEGALIPLAERFGAGIFEKPFRQAVLASYLRRGIASAEGR